MTDEHFHPDELNFIETRAQTEHKLEVMRRYFGQYAAIIAQSQSTRIDNRHIWLIDARAIAGLRRLNRAGIAPCE